VGGQYHDAVPILQEAKWASELVQMGKKNLNSTRVQTLNSPAHGITILTTLSQPPKSLWRHSWF